MLVGIVVIVLTISHGLETDFFFHLFWFAVFQVVCSVLNSLDEGLVCSSNCNIETAMETSFQCYYILLPSDKGLMLLRVIAFCLSPSPSLCMCVSVSAYLHVTLSFFPFFPSCPSLHIASPLRRTLSFLLL